MSWQTLCTWPELITTPLTWVWPAISMPASRNSSKSWLNFPEATASWLLGPLEAWTTSPADWFRSAAVWFSSFWASWKDLEAGGIWKENRRTSWNSIIIFHLWVKTKRQTHSFNQQLLAGLSDAFESHVHVLLSRQTVDAVVQGVRDSLGHLENKEGSFTAAWAQSVWIGSQTNIIL